MINIYEQTKNAIASLLKVFKGFDEDLNPEEVNKAVKDTSTNTKEIDSTTKNIMSALPELYSIIETNSVITNNVYTGLKSIDAQLKPIADFIKNKSKRVYIHTETITNKYFPYKEMEISGLFIYVISGEVEVQINREGIIHLSTDNVYPRQFELSAEPYKNHNIGLSIDATNGSCLFVVGLIESNS